MRRLRRVLFWSAVPALALVAVYAVLRLTVYDIIRFRASSDMWPNLGPGALVVVNRLRTPQRGDLVVIRTKQDKLMIRRVVGLPGETLAMIDSRPFIDGLEVSWEEQWHWMDDKRRMIVNRERLGGASYLVVDDDRRRMSNTYAAPIEGGYYVLADHREHVMGKDSREIGPVPREQIRGVVVWVIDAGTLPDGSWSGGEWSDELW